MSNFWILASVLFIPIIVHLFSFRRAKKYLFPTLKFIRRVSADSKSRTKPKHYFILFSRILIFSALLLILLLHFLDFTDLSTGKDNNISVDNSLSMSIEYNGISAFELANSFHRNTQEFAETTNASIGRISNTYLFDNASNIIVSDFQGQSVDELSKVFRDSSVIHNYILAGNLNDVANLFIDTLTTTIDPNDFSQRIIRIDLGTSSSFQDGNVVIKLFKNDKQLSSVVKDVSSLSSIEFDIPIGYSGDFLVKLEGDVVPYDNDFRFEIGSLEKTSIVLIESEPNLFLEKLFENSNLFIFSKMNSSAIDYEVIKGVDVVILNELETLPSGLEAILREKVVIIFPNMDLNRSSYHSLTGINTTEKNSNDPFEIAFDFSHPVFSGVFEKISNQNSLPNSIPAYSLSGNFEEIIRLRNGDPFLVKSILGSYYFFNTPLRETYTNIASHSVFLPLLYQLTLSYAGNEARSFYYPGDLFYVEVSNGEIPPFLIGEDTEMIPEFNPNGSGIVIRIPDDLSANFYSILHAGDTVSRIAVNSPKTESLMEAPLLEELQKEFGDLNHVSFQSLEDAKEGLQNSGERTSLFKYALILVVMFLISETLFHRYLR